MRLSLIFLSAMMIASCATESDHSNANTEFEQLLKDYYEEGLILDPLQATFSGDNRYNDQMPNYLSAEYKANEKAYYSKFKEQAASFDAKDLSEQNRMSQAVLNWECDINLQKMNYHEDLEPLDQMWTRQLSVGQLASGAGAQPFKTVQDYNDWLKRLDNYVAWLGSAEDNMRQGIEKGYVLPKALTLKVIPQLESMCGPSVEDHLFYAPVREFPDGFSDVDKHSLTEAYRERVAEQIIPAYQKLTKFMKEEYLPAGRETSGVDVYEDGQDYYQHQIKKYTTTNMTAEEIHQLGLKEVARIRSEMEKVKEEVGFEGTLLEFFDYVRNNPELMSYDDPKEVVAHFHEIHERMKPHLAKLFDMTPKTPFEVRRTEAFREASASAEYNPGSVDGTRPGIFYVPIPNVKKYNDFSDESLFLHEAIPGHHYQISLTQENEALPDFRKTLWYSSYGEGWALYCESLGKELGLYTNPYQYFGMLSQEMHRAIRLVVDTGIHAKGWSREQAIQYSLENEAESEEGIISEIERYMAEPGQALSYKIGQLKIQELRAKAEAELGDKFDIAEFHNILLEPGCIPLALLEESINDWIAEQKEV